MTGWAQSMTPSGAPQPGAPATFCKSFALLGRRRTATETYAIPARIEAAMTLIHICCMPAKGSADRYCTAHNRRACI